MYFTNYNLTDIVTPVKANVLKQLLLESDYDSVKTEFLITGFTKGFRLEYTGPRDVQQFAPNLKLNSPEDKIIVWNKVMKEV